MQLLHVLYWFVTRGPLALGAVAIALLGLGFYLQIGENEKNAARAAALQAGPPAVVDIAKFNSNDHMSAVREVAVRAQPVLDYAYRLTYEKEYSTDNVFMVPLVSANSNSDTDIVGIAYFTSDSEEFENITPELLMAGFVGFGDVGPQINYNGKLSGMGQWADLTEDSFWDEGLTMPDNPVVVWPYMEGRGAALAPPEQGDMTIFGIVSKVAGAVALLALGKLVFGGKGPAARAPEPASTYQPGQQPDPVQGTSGVPLYKQRDGSVADAGVAPQPVRPARPQPAVRTTAQAREANPLESFAKPRQSGISVRKVLIGCVAALFAMLLTATVIGLVPEAAPEDSAQNPALASVASQTTPPEVQAAQRLADAVIPDPAPSRHWTDIDVTPVLEWFTAKAVLAAAGDVDAQITIGMVVGGVFVVMFLIRWFFVMRRALRPRTTARFDSMGIN